MPTAILTAHARNGIWSHERGFEFPLLLLALGLVISALGAGSYSIHHWAGVPNWAGIHWSMSYVARAAIVLAIGVGGGLATVLLGYVARSIPPGRVSRPRANAHTANVSGRLGSGTARPS